MGNRERVRGLGGKEGCAGRGVEKDIVMPLGKANPGFNDPHRSSSKGKCMGSGDLFIRAAFLGNESIHESTDIHCLGMSTKLCQGLSTEEGNSGSVRSSDCT